MLIPHAFYADDIYMKKALFFAAPMSVITVFILIFAVNCTGSPSPSSSSPAANGTTISTPSRTDIWSLLQRGDSRARGYFLGEIDVNAVDGQGRTPLHYAAERRDAELAKFFIALRANTNALDNERQSPLGICVDNNDAVIAELLVSAGADIHLPIKNTTAAVLALNKSSSLFRALLNPSSAVSVDASGKNVLHMASISGKTESVTDILSILPLSSASINVRDNDAKNALDYALSYPDSKNHIEIAEKLILSGANSENPIYSYFAPAVRSANYNIRRDGLAPIHYAVINNYAGLFSFLIDKEVDVNIKSTSGATPLHEAVRSGNIAFIRILLNNNADVNARDGNNNTPLHLGIPSNVHSEIITMLLEKKADTRLRDEHGDTPLHIAIILNRSFDVIQALLGGGSDVYSRNIEGKTPLYIAIQEKRENLIPVLLAYHSEIFAADNSGVTPFDLAAKSNDNIINLLFTNDETMRQRDGDGNTMLHCAIKNSSNSELIGRILDQNVIIDSRNRDGDTALHIAVRMNQRDNGEFLISRTASIFSINSSGESPLYIAFTASDGLREWIINPATIIAKDGLGNNMLHYAAQWNLDAIIPVIIRNGISVEEANATGETPLFLAINNPSTIRTLVANNANLNARDTQGNSILHAAVRWNAVNSAALLVTLGIDINVHSLTGNTPLHDAVIRGMDQIETILINSKANLEVRNIEGNTPLMEAVRLGKFSSADKLARNRADPNTRNISGDTPLHLAVGMERYDLVNLLLGLGTSIHARNTRNRTPFQISLSISPRMASALLTSGRIAASDDDGNSVLHIALRERVTEDYIRAIISQAGVRLDAVDNNGKTPLRIAVDSNLFEAAKIIADAGADPFLAAVDNKSPAEISFSKGDECIRALFSGRAINSRDSSENTILHYAARYGTPEAISLLIELGANKTIRNISSELPVEIALRWDRRENAEILR